MKKILIVTPNGDCELEDANRNGHPGGPASRLNSVQFVLGVEVNDNGTLEIDVIKARGGVEFI